MTNAATPGDGLYAVINGEAVGKAYVAGRHGVAAPSETIERVNGLAEVIGITRVANVTGLDRLGIPVVSVCRPNARSLALSQGKGLDLDAAMASGLMESAEIWHAENVEHRLRFDDFAGLARTERVVDVAGLPRLKDSRYSEHLRMLWIEGEDLVSGTRLWLPYETVRADFVVPQPPGSGCFDASTNGLASGLHALEAIIHGTCEVIERDAISLMFHRPTAEWHRRRVIAESIAEPSAAALLQLIASAGLDIAVWDITTDLAIPAFYVLLLDRRDETSHLGIGSGCHLSPAVALTRAITEAAQVRTTYLSGAREDLGDDDYDLAFLAQRARWALGVAGGGAGALDFAAIRDLSATTLNEDFETLKRSLMEAGVEQIVAVDLSRRDFPIAVVKMVIPGVEGPHDHAAYQPGPRAQQLRR